MHFVQDIVVREGLGSQRIIKRWGWKQLPADPLKGLAVIVYSQRSKDCNATDYRFHLHLHAQRKSKGQCIVGNDPIYIGTPSKLKRVRYQPLRAKMRETAPSGKTRVRVVTLRRPLAIRSSSTVSAIE